MYGIGQGGCEGGQEVHDLGDVAARRCGPDAEPDRAAGSLAVGGPAAAGTGFYPAVMDLTLSPGHSWGPASGAGGIPDRTVVYAFSKKPLTDATWSGGGLPSGLTVSAGTEGCKIYAGVPGIFTCPVTEDNVFDEPTVTASTTAANDTTAYVGVAYAARGASITTAVKAAEVAATTNTDPQQQTAAVIKVKTAATPRCRRYGRKS